MDVDDTPEQVLAQLLRRADPVPRPAVSGPAEVLTYAQLAARAGAVTARLAATGIQPGDRVALIGVGSPEWVAAFLGVLALGAVAVPVDPHLTAGELTVLLDDCGARLILGGPEQPAGGVPRLPLALGDGPAWTTPVPRDSPDPAVLVYTSGTTGAPKGVTLSWRNLAYQLAVLPERIRFTTSSSLVSILPLHHLFELTGGCLLVLAAGARVHYPGSMLPADILAAIASTRATELTAVPLLLAALRRRIEQEMAAAPESLRLAYQAALTDPDASLAERRERLAPLHSRLGGRLHTWYPGGARLDPALAVFFERLGFQVCQGYGMSEAAPVLAVNTREDNRIGTVGRPLAGTEARIVDGELLVRGPGVMLGYWNRPELTAATVDADGWLHTGDLAELDAEGFLTVAGRARDLIVLPSGENVVPEEVESRLLDSALVGQVCVLEDETRGGVLAVVSPAADVSLESVQADLRRQVMSISAFKRPNRYLLVDGPLPQTTSRKVRRDEVRKLVAALETR